jgi:hypothetical protein
MLINTDRCFQLNIWPKHIGILCLTNIFCFKNKSIYTVNHYFSSGTNFCGFCVDYVGQSRYIRSNKIIFWLLYNYFFNIIYILHFGWGRLSTNLRTHENVIFDKATKFHAHKFKWIQSMCEKAVYNLSIYITVCGNLLVVSELHRRKSYNLFLKVELSNSTLVQLITSFGYMS